MTSVVLLVGLLMACLPGSSHGFLWTISNGLGEDFIPNHEKLLQGEISSSNRLIGVEKFEFFRHGRYNFAVDVRVFSPLGKMIRTMNRESPGSAFDTSKPMFHLLVCGAEQYNELYQMEASGSGAFCSYRFKETPSLCEEIPGHYVFEDLEDSEGRDSYPSDSSQTIPSNYVGKWSIGAAGSLLDTDTLYFVLAACEFVDRFPIRDDTELIVEANYNFQNPGGNFLTVSETKISYGLLVNLFLLFLLIIVWRIHITRYASRQDVTVQRSLAILFSIKSLVICTMYLGYQAKANGTMVWASHMFYYMKFLTSLVFYLFFIKLMLNLAIGVKITINQMNPLDRLKINRLILVFGIVLSLFLWWGSMSILLWVLLMFIYIIIVSTLFQLSSLSVRELMVQLEIGHERLRTARSLDDSIAEWQITQHCKFIRETLHIFSRLRLAVLWYFGVNPFLLMIGQVILVRLVGDDTMLLLFAEFLDIMFFYFLAITCRARSIEPYLRTEPPSSDDDSSTEDARPRSENQSSYRNESSERSTIPSSAVVPMFESERESSFTRKPPGEERKKSEDAEIDNPIITVTNFNENSNSLAIAYDYKV